MPERTDKLSFRMRLSLWRARLSTPVLLARHEERKVISVVTAINGGLAILTIGLFAWLSDLPLIFPALGPSTFILFSSPLTPSGAPRSVILGHVLALGCGYLVWQVISHLAGVPVALQPGGWLIICSASVALAVTCLVLLWFSCPHPPACASSLVVALGAVTDWRHLLLMAFMVTWLTFQAWLMNRFAGLPVPIWAPRNES